MSSLAYYSPMKQFIYDVVCKIPFCTCPPQGCQNVREEMQYLTKINMVAVPRQLVARLVVYMQHNSVISVVLM